MTSDFFFSFAIQSFLLLQSSLLILGPLVADNRSRTFVHLWDLYGLLRKLAPLSREFLFLFSLERESISGTCAISSLSWMINKCVRATAFYHHTAAQSITISLLLSYSRTFFPVGSPIKNCNNKWPWVRFERMLAKLNMLRIVNTKYLLFMFTALISELSRSIFLLLFTLNS